MPLSKSGVVYSHRGFESHPLRRRELSVRQVVMRSSRTEPSRPTADLAQVGSLGSGGIRRSCSCSLAEIALVVSGTPASGACE